MQTVKWIEMVHLGPTETVRTLTIDIEKVRVCGGIVILSL